MAQEKAVDGVTTGMSPYTPLELQEMGIDSDTGDPGTGEPEEPVVPGQWGYGVEPKWAGPGLAPHCTVPNLTSWQVRRYHTRHQNHRRYHYHHAPAS
jgi:hypothetical protein